MKRALISILLIGILTGTACADTLQKASDEAVMETDCHSVMIYRICTAQVQGKQLYVVLGYKECSQINPWNYVISFNYDDIGKAREYRDLLNVYLYKKCIDQKKQDAIDEAVKSAEWKEVK